MSIYGSSVHSEIQGKVREAESKHSKLESALYEVESQIEGLSADREKCYGTLAVHYLPELEAQAVKETLKEVREQVDRVFRAKRERRAVLEKLMGENRDANKKIEKEIGAAEELIREKREARDAVVSQINEAVSENPGYAALDSEAKKAEARLQHDKQRVSEVAEEARAKIPAFEENRLFKYLFNCGYGTESYESSGLRRRLDNWVAEKIGFADNKKCYDFLKSMPELMAAEVARRQKELDEIVKSMKVIEAEAAEKYSLPKITAEGEKLVAQKRKLAEKDEAQDKEHRDYTEERARIDSAKDPYHQEAIGKIKAFLKGETIQYLKEKARQTPGTEDDALVDKIEKIDLAVRQLKDRAIETRKERDEFAARLEGIRKIERRFVSNDYDGSYSRFSSGFDIDSLLVGYMLGRISENHVMSEIDSSHHVERPTYRSSSYSSSSSSDYSSHHSSSSDSFSSGGGFGGGGFSSGSGF